MSVRNDLERIREILIELTKREDCAEITRFNKVAINCFIEGLDRAIKHYKSEAKRIRKYARVY